MTQETKQDIKNYISEFESERQFSFNKLMEAEFNHYDSEEMWSEIHSGYSDMVDKLKRLLK